MKKLLSCVFIFLMAAIIIGCDDKPKYTLAKSARGYGDSYIMTSSGTSNLGLYGAKYGIDIESHMKQELVIDTKFPYENLKVGMLVVFQGKYHYGLIDHPVFRKLGDGTIVTKGFANMEEDGPIDKAAYVGLITKVKNKSGVFVPIKYE